MMLQCHCMDFFKCQSKKILDTGQGGNIKINRDKQTNCLIVKTSLQRLKRAQPKRLNSSEWLNCFAMK